MYAKVENGVVIETKGKPKWFDDNGSSVSDAYLIEKESLFPVVQNPPTIDSDRQRLNTEAKDQWIVNTDSVEVTYTVVDKTVEEVQNVRIREVESLRDSKLETMSYTLESGQTIEVKISEDSPSKPRQSWLTMTVNKAIMAEMRNNSFTEDIIAADDTKHTMSSSEWMTFGEAMQERIMSVVTAANTHIDNIKATTTIDDALAYTVTID